MLRSLDGFAFSANPVFFILFVLSSFFASFPAQAQVPARLSYQGLLTGPTGTPVPDGQYQLTFRLYADDGTEALWSETQTLATSEGLFAASLGAVEALALPFDQGYFLTVELVGEVESERIPLASSAYAMKAKDVADGAVVRSISGLRDAVELVAGEGIAIEQQENRLVISALSAPVGLRPAPGTRPRSKDDLAVALAEADDSLGTAGGAGVAGTPATALLGAGGSNTGLDAAYDAGRVITVDGGVVDLVRPTAASSVILRVLDGDLRVQKTAGTSAAALSLLVSNGKVSQSWYVQTRGTNGAFEVRDVTGGKTPFQITPNTTSGLLKLDGSTVSVNGSLDVGGAAVVRPGGSGGALQFGTPSAETGMTIVGANRADVRFDGATLKLLAGAGTGPPAATNGLVVTTNGFVGIGTPNPSFRLDVNTNVSGAIYGKTTSSSYQSIGVYGESNSQAGIGVFGRSSSYVGVYGESSSSYPGVVGSSGSGLGVHGYSSSHIGVYGSSTSSYAGFFAGKVHVNGTLTKGGGAFKIDHPLDPENKTLAHSFVESPDMMNVYNGNIRLDRRGEAVVALPDYFEALNRDFRYQLTCIGGFAPVYIAEKVQGNRFKIAGGEPGMEISWQVTGIRHDPFAETNRIVVEETKPTEEQGRYLHPKAFGLPAERGVEALRLPPGAPRPPLPVEQDN